MTPIEVRNVVKTFDEKSGKNIVLEGIDMKLEEGEITGLIGRSGSGKSTLSRLLLKLEEPTSGTIYLDEKPIQEIPNNAYYKKIHIVFQNATAALNPSWRVQTVLEEVLTSKKEKWGLEQLEMLKSMNLSPSILAKYPSQLSGGEKQRVNLLRALLMNPTVLICDEIVSNLDRINQKELIQLLVNYQKRSKMTILFISHDLDIVKAICSSIYELEKGKLIRIR
ncbi:ABC transporter ATP-binding protein [Sporosarcina sp. CAU 1771]